MGLWDLRGRQAQEGNLDCLDFPGLTDCLETTAIPAGLESRETKDRKDTRALSDFLDLGE